MSAFWLLLPAALLLASTSVDAMSFFPHFVARDAEEAAATADEALQTDYQVALADKVVVRKAERRLYLMKDDKPFRSYPVSLGIEPVGHKVRQGDGRTPEGRYLLTWRNPRSQYYRSILISYPNTWDRLRARELGVDPGGMIMVHGQPRPNAHRELQEILSGEDWTQGCVAVSNLAIDEIWELTRDGTPIEILP
jgi:murein L,D-transpeptidase YafK